MGYIEGQDRNQVTLFPESIDDYISDDSPVRVVDEYVEHLAICSLEFKKSASPSIGRPPYDHKDVLKLYLYGS